MAKLYPFLFFFFMLALPARAQVPGDSVPAENRVSSQDQGKDTLAPGHLLKGKISMPPADSLLHHLPDSAGRLQFNTHSDSLRRRRVHAQMDSLRKRQIRLSRDSSRVDQIPAYTDSLRFSNTKPGLKQMPVNGMDLLESNPFLNFLGNPVKVKEDKYEFRSYDGLFYLLLGMLFFFAIVKRVFGKYLGNLLTLFFRVSMRQLQIREQVLQSPFPSLLLNLLFILSGGLYATFLLQYEHYGTLDQFWDFFLYSALILMVIYGVKFLVLKMAAWIFNIKRTVEIYLFIVFMTNKIIGIFLLPFLVILSFSDYLVSSMVITGSLVMIGIFYIYRVIASYNALRKEIKISRLHFFLYLCAFEIAPLLLIYKVLLTDLGKAD